MTEYIRKEQALEAVTRNLSLYGDEWIAAYNIVGAIPPADVVEVVRCKDCRHKMTDEILLALAKNKDTALFCERMGGVISEMFYCGAGERMDGEEKPQKEIPEEYSREPGAGGWDCSDEEYNYSGYVRDVINGGW